MDISKVSRHSVLVIGSTIYRLLGVNFVTAEFSCASVSTSVVSGYIRDIALYASPNATNSFYFSLNISPSGITKTDMANNTANVTFMIIY